jgi:hypothetical protein
MANLKPPELTLEEALEALEEELSAPRLCDIGQKDWLEYVKRIRSLLSETPDQRAERLLGKWLVDHPGTAYNVAEYLWGEEGAKRGMKDEYAILGISFDPGRGPTKAGAILDALRKAGCKDV